VLDDGIRPEIRRLSNSNPALPETTQAKDIAAMDQSTDELKQAKDKMVSDIKTVIADSKNLVKTTAQATGAGVAVVREKIDESLSSAKGMLSDASRPVIDKARQTAVAANHYVHGNPWAVIGIAVAASALIGFLAARRSCSNAGQGNS